jgi:pimeloyl-ACP methyl ester carboxylesterase
MGYLPMDNSSSPAPVKRWLRWILVSLLLLALFLIVSGFIYENISEARDRRIRPMPGLLVDVGGKKIHINCSGEGSPVVVLDSGLGDTYASWRKVQPEIARFTRVCSYDRAGLGYSDSGSAPRTSKVIAGELHDLLEAATVAPPYLLVGHSMGGYDVRLYASLFSSEVAGMVLVDASHPDQHNRLPPELEKMEGTWQRQAKFLEFSMPFGIPRFLGFCGDDPVARAAECNFHSARGGMAEWEAFPASAAQTAATGSLGDRPLAVLSHDPDRPLSGLPPDLARATNQAWEKMQEDLAHLSTRGTQTIARNSAHYIQTDRPDIVIDAIRSVLSQLRANPPAGNPRT